MYSSSVATNEIPPRPLAAVRELARQLLQVHAPAVQLRGRLARGEGAAGQEGRGVTMGVIWEINEKHIHPWT